MQHDIPRPVTGTLSVPLSVTVTAPDSAALHVLDARRPASAAPARGPLLLVHGWAGSATTWLARAGGLTEAFDVVAPDLRGHGRSAAGARWESTSGSDEDVLDVMVGDLVRGLDELGIERCVAVGHSMGGQLVARLGDTHPDRVAATVVVDPSYGNDSLLPAQVMADRAHLLAGGTPAVLEALAGGVRLVGAAPVRAALEEDARAASAVVLADATRDQYVAPTSWGMRERSRELLQRRSRPALALYSTARAAAVERELGAGAPVTAQVETWDGTSHWLHLEEPERFTALLTAWYDATLSGGRRPRPR